MHAIAGWTRTATLHARRVMSAAAARFGFGWLALIWLCTYHAGSVGLSRAFLIGFIWCGFAWIGVKGRLFASLIVNSVRREDPTWNGVLLSNLLSVPVTLLLIRSVAPERLLVSYVLATIIVYIGAKLGCAINGCCGIPYSQPNSSVLYSRRLQLIELLASVTLVSLLLLQMSASYAAICLGIHLLLRIVAYRFRQRRILA